MACAVLSDYGTDSFFLNDFFYSSAISNCGPSSSALSSCQSWPITVENSRCILSALGNKKSPTAHSSCVEYTRSIWLYFFLVGYALLSFYCWDLALLHALSLKRLCLHLWLSSERNQHQDVPAMDFRCFLGRTGPTASELLPLHSVPHSLGCRDSRLLCWKYPRQAVGREREP